MLGKLFVTIFDRVFVVAGAFLLTQVPLFYQQYLQRLSGHVAELEHQAALLRSTAARSGKTLQAYIDKFLSYIDPDLSAQGEYMESLINRLHEMRASFQALVDAPVWYKPLYLIEYGDREIVEATFRQFSPGLALSWETAVYALAGMLLGVILFKSIRLMFWVSYKLTHYLLSIKKTKDNTGIHVVS